MAERRKASIRLWQTGLFVVVIVVATLILSGSLSAGVKATLTRMAQTTEVRNVSALAQRLEAQFPPGAEGREPLRAVIAEYRAVYGSGVWVYDADGELLESAFEGAPVDAVLEAAQLRGLVEGRPYVSSDLREGGWVVASRPLRDSAGEVAGVVIVANAADQPAAILKAVRDRLWVTFWVSLVIAGLLGYGFSALISSRITALSDAAAAIADGDFDQRLPTGLVPGEIQDLAESYNRMASKLGSAFAEVHEGRRWIAAVVESMAEGVLAVDATQTVNVMNPEAARLLGATGDGAVTGLALAETTSQDAVVSVVREGLAGDSVARLARLGARDVLMHCTPLVDEAGAVEGAVLLLSDVTERRRVEEAQRRFVSDASHEMRTPIAALKGMLELLEDGAKEVPEVRDDFIRTMAAETERLGRLVTDLLTLAQLDAGSLKLERGPVSVAEIMGDAARVMQPLAEKAGVRVSVENHAGEARVDADRDRILQVLIGFTDNALKHSGGGGTIHLRASLAGGTVRLEVADEGEGIASEEVARVFERFYRSDSARAGGGAGLGLAIAKEIVEAHGASIEVASTPGEGTAFSFALPAA